MRASAASSAPASRRFDGLIPSPLQQSGDGNVLVDVVPVQPEMADFDRLALQAREPIVGNADRAPVRQLSPHRVVVEPNRLGRDRHNIRCSVARPSWPGLSRPSTRFRRRLPCSLIKHLIKIIPTGIGVEYQPGFPSPWPVLDVVFALNCGGDCLMKLLYTRRFKPYRFVNPFTRPSRCSYARRPMSEVTPV